MKVFKYISYILLFWATLLVLWQRFMHVFWQSSENYIPSKLIVDNTTTNSLNDVQYVYDLLELHNKVRLERGLPPLKLSYELQKSAYLKAFDMLVFDYWSHNNTKVPRYTPWFFIRRYIPEYKVAGENLARGFLTPEQVMQAWLNSPTHRENILDPRYTHIGIFRLHGKLGKKTTDIIVAHFAALDISQKVGGKANFSLDSFTLLDELVPDIWVYIPNIHDALIISNKQPRQIDSNKEDQAFLKTDVFVAGVSKTPGRLAIKDKNDSTNIGVEVYPGVFFLRMPISLDGPDSPRTILEKGFVNRQLLITWAGKQFRLPLRLAVVNNKDQSFLKDIYILFDGTKFELKQSDQLSESAVDLIYNDYMNPLTVVDSSRLRKVSALAESSSSATLGITDYGGIRHFLYKIFNPIVVLGIAVLSWLIYLISEVIRLYKAAGGSLQHISRSNDYRKHILGLRVETLFAVAYVVVLFIVMRNGTGGV